MASGGRPKETTPETALGEFEEADAGGMTIPGKSRRRGRTNSTSVPRKSYILGPLRSTLTPRGMPGLTQPPMDLTPFTIWTPVAECLPPPCSVCPEIARDAMITPRRLLRLEMASLTITAVCMYLGSLAEFFD